MPAAADLSGIEDASATTDQHVSEVKALIGEEPAPTARPVPGWPGLALTVAAVPLDLSALAGCACPAGYSEADYTCLPPVVVPFP